MLVGGYPLCKAPECRWVSAMSGSGRYVQAGRPEARPSWAQAGKSAGPMPGEAPRSWDPVAKALHWGMAALIFAQVGLGWLAVAWPLSPAKLDLFVWHKSFGLLILLLALFRLGWRLSHCAPPLPPHMPRWERRGARASHLFLYVLMFALPVSGWIINSAANIPFKVFWLFPLPDLAAPDKGLEELVKAVHFGLFLCLAGALAMHVSAALRHHFVVRDDVLLRMLPSRGHGS